LRFVWALLARAWVKYDETDGEQRAASFAYYAFFALFPLLILMISFGTLLLGSPELALHRVTEQMAQVLPKDSEMSAVLIRAAEGVVAARRPAGLIAFAVLAWSALKFFQSLVHGVNRAWGTRDYPWWRMPGKNLLMMLILASALLVGVVVPAVLAQLQRFYSTHLHGGGVGLEMLDWLVGGVFGLLLTLVPLLVLSYGLCMFYKFAPQRRPDLGGVWREAVGVALGLQGLKSLFVVYTRSVADFNALYGAFGSVVALLLWIYLSGAVIIFGGCLCAARDELADRHADAGARDVRTD
jgi:Ca2+-transporting ATPase